MFLSVLNVIGHLILRLSVSVVVRKISFIVSVLRVFLLSFMIKSVVTSLFLVFG